MIACTRIGFAAVALYAPKLATAFIGGKPSQMTPIAIGWAGAFASREAALGAVTLGSEAADPTCRRKVLLLNAAVDALDTLTFLALAKRQRSLLPILIGAPGAVFSAYTHYQAAQQLDAASGSASTPYESAYAPA